MTMIKLDVPILTLVMKKVLDVCIKERFTLIKKTKHNDIKDATKDDMKIIE